MELKDDRRFHNLTREQVETLDQVLTEVIPIHGRGNFPTLEIKPKDIIHVVRDRLVSKHIKVRDVRLNGSTASHVLVKENGTSYKDLDIIFGVELPKAEDFQVIKEVVLSCLLDFLPPGVNKNKITVLTMKEAYVQKMVKVFTEHDRWSLISLCNNSGKNVELKFVSSLRRQFEFSVDSFQIILDTMLESYLEAERQEAAKLQEEQNTENASDVLNEQMTSVSTQSFEETDINMSDERKDILNECHSDSEIIEGNKPSTGEIPIDLTNKDKPEERASSVASAAPAEKTAELTENNIKENTETFLTTNVMVEINSNSNTMCESDDQSEMQPLDTETHPHINDPGHNNTPPQLVEPAPLIKLASTSSAHKPVKNIEIDPEPMILTDQCTFQPSHGVTFLPKTTQDSNEFSAPPPAKKTSWTSQMVILKHSSPKPPRKMSRKMMCSSKGKPAQPNSLKSVPNQSMSMQVESQGLTTNCSSSASNDPDFSTPPLQDQNQNPVPDGILPVACSPEATQKPEPETGETTNHSALSAVSENVPTEMEIQSYSEIKTCPDPVTPIIQINSLPVVELDDGQAVLPKTAGKDETKTLSQNSEHHEHLKFPKNNTHTSDSLSDLDRTVHGLGLPQCSKPPLVTQEPPVPQTPPLEPSVLTSEPVDTSVLIAQAQEHPTTSTPSSCVSEKEEYVAWSSESSMLSSDGPEPSSISISPLELPEVFPKILILEPFVEPSQLTCPSAPPNKEPEPMVLPQTTSESSTKSHSESKDQLKPPREVPHVTVVAESMYGDFEQAMDHLRYRLIATRNPEEIRGGGLLKYSNLLVRDFKPASETEIKTLERYMCSRFFIDFPDVNEQQRKIESYLRNHFIGEEKSKYDYLMTLRRVVNESTVCLMGHERRQTLNMITILALKVLGEQNIIPNANNVTCYYQPAPYMADHNFSNYYIANGQSPLIYHPYPLHIHMQTGLV